MSAKGRAARLVGDIGRLSGDPIAYLALPGKVVLCLPAPVQRDQKVRARVSILHGEAGLGHFLAGCWMLGLAFMSWAGFGGCPMARDLTGGLREAHSTLDRLDDSHFGGNWGV